MTSPLAAAVAAYGLATEHRLPNESLDDPGFDSLLAECEHHRILGLLGMAVRRDAFPVSDSQRARLEETWSAWLAHALRVERLAVDATEVLGGHDIDSIVLKGVALAHTIYPDAAMRVVGDVDVLVESHNFTRAANALIAEMQCTRGLPEIRAGFDDRFGKEILLQVRGIEFDLHRTFSDGALGQTVKLQDLFTDPTPFTIGGRSLRALGPVPMTMHAAYTTCFGDHPPLLAPMRDLAESLDRTAQLEQELLATAHRWRATAVLAKAIQRSVETLALPSDTAIKRWANTYRAKPFERLLVEAHTGPARGYTRQLAALTVVPGVRARWTYALAIAFPDEEYLHARGLRRGGLVRQARTRLAIKP